MKRTSQLLSGVLVATLVVAAGGCGSKKDGAGKAGKAGAGKALVAAPAADAPDGLELRLSEGSQGKPATDRATLAPATKLADAAVAQLLARAPALAEARDDRKDFALRPRSQPPPQTGSVVSASFPPPAGSNLPPPVAADASRPLEVVRFQPEGDVPLVPQLSVTFNHPMVAVTSQDDAAKVVPVTLTPQPKGRWRWIGTRTIVFDPEVRFPQATTYQVEVGAGTKSATGAAMAAPVRFSFTTPPPRMVQYWPDGGGPQRRDVPIFVQFDQEIDPAAVLAKIELRAGGSKQKLQLLDDATAGGLRELKDLVAGARRQNKETRWLALRPVAPLPADASIDVTIGAGTPSKEGPNRSKEPQSFSFRTYAPLAIERSQCSWERECPPGTPYWMEFNNPLDQDLFKPDQITVSPTVPGLQVTSNGSNVSLRGATKAHTTYTITVSGEVRDEFGQTLGKRQTLRWEVGAARPTFFGPEGMVVLDPSGKRPTLDYFSVNYTGLRVQLYQVGPDDYAPFVAAMQRRWDRKDPPTIPGAKVFDQVVPTTKGKDELVESAVDLSAALGKGGLGHVIAVVEPSPWTEKHDPPRKYTWVQSTHLGLDAYVDGEDVVGFVSDLATGVAAEGVALRLTPGDAQAQTAAGGLATFALPAPGAAATMLRAERGDDVAFLAGQGGWFSQQAWYRQVRGESLAWYVTDDRQMYRPGEKVHLKGWLRAVDHGQGGDVAGVDGKVSSVSYQVNDATGNKIGSGLALVNALGGFEVGFSLPATPNLGYAWVELHAVGALGGQHRHEFQIQEFRRPEFEVGVRASDGPHLVGAGADVTASAKYFAGGGLPDAAVTWTVSSSQTSYTPPGRDDFVFGSWTPWWGYHRWWIDDEDGYGYGGGRGRGGPEVKTLAGKTDAVGDHLVHLDFVSVKPAVPMTVNAQVTIVDVNRQAWAKGTTLLVHPSTRYVGLKAKRQFVEKGTPIELETIAVDLDGKATPGQAVAVQAVREHWRYQGGKYELQELDPQDCKVVAAADAVPCSFATKEGGTYKITATVTDDQGRANTSSLTVWVTGGDLPPQRELEQEQVNLIPDKKEYRVGEVAELMVQAPFYPAEGVVSWRRSGLVHHELIKLAGPSTVIKVPLTEAHVPNLTVQVDLVGQAARLDDAGQADKTLPPRPAYAVGSIDLAIPPRTRTLAVEVAPAQPKLGPGETASFAVKVKDAAGQPVAGAEVALLVVDEAILSLTGMAFASPIDSFYPHRPSGVSDYYLRSHVKLARPDQTVGPQTAQGEDEDAVGGTGTAMALEEGRMGKMEMADLAAAPPSTTAPAAPGGAPKKANGNFGVGRGGGGKGQSDAPIAVRTNFDPLAAFAPTLRTDGAGAATLSVKIPDNVTRYRVVALAVAGDKQYGKGESSLTARLPLMVRPSPPRFLNFGDTFRLPVVLQNQTDAAITVRVAVRASNATLTDGGGREVSIPAGDRVEVQFPAAAEMAGTARFQIVGTISGSATADAAEVALPVWTPATTEAFATYGVIDDGAIRQPVALPGSGAGGGTGGVVKQFGGLEVTTSSTNLQALTDAMLYLVTYPFECSEQRASRILAIAALRDVLSAFAVAGMPSPAEMEARVAADLERLENMQNSDGGFPIWERGRETWPFLTVHVVNALARAKAKGYPVDAEMLDQAEGYLADIESHYPHYYGEEVRRSISAYALYVRKLVGKVDVPKARRLISQAGGVDKLSMEAVGWLLGTLAGQADAASERAALLRHLGNKVSETAGAANFTTSYSDGGHLLLHSDRRVDGIILESLIQEAEKSDLIPKLVTGLLGHKKAGRWLNTQENSFALLALDRYFATYEKVTPNFVARIWLGDGYAGDHTFRGRTTERFQLDVPMAWVADQLGRGKTPGQGDLVLQKDGAGRLYYRIGMTYAPADLKVPAADYGFVVERRYEHVDDPADVVRQADGSWKIKAGARVRVRLTMVAENRRYHVALVDPLPAGLEVMNPALAVTGDVPQDPSAQASGGGRYWWWAGTWYEHQNLRDERVEAFASLLWEGVHQYTYVARATTPGSFVVPPAKAEEMYMPETFGRSDGDRVVIE